MANPVSKPKKARRSGLRFLPTQIDPYAGTSSRAREESPVRLFLRDVLVLIQNLRYMPWLFLPLYVEDRDSELYITPAALHDGILLLSLVLLEVMLLPLSPVLLALPVLVVLFAGLSWGYVRSIILLPTQGPKIVRSVPGLNVDDQMNEFGDERWVFINGFLTGQVNMQRAIDNISRIFGRPVIGIHNESAGLIGDVMEALLQRCLFYTTVDCRIAYDYIKASLLDPKVKKLVLLAHSQGGIMTSLIVDELTSDLPHDLISKLEIYTFGSAAAHFSNPLESVAKLPKSVSWAGAGADTRRQHTIRHIEHYVNEYDLVPRWGVLSNTYGFLSNRYSGRVFIRLGATGHLFNAHYLSSIFPSDSRAAAAFLDQTVDVDMDVRNAREREAIRLRQIMGSGERSLARDASVNAVQVEAGDEVESWAGLERRDVVGREVEGLRMRDVSRLWKYVDGGKPTD